MSRDLSRRIRIHPFTMNDVPPVAIPVFSAENYGKIMQLLTGVAEQAHVPYDQYVASAEQHIQQLQASGVTVHRVPVLPDHLIYWCERHNRPVDREAISLFAMAQLAEQA